jgi:hypothetical protein
VRSEGVSSFPQRILSGWYAVEDHGGWGGRPLIHIVCIYTVPLPL